MKDIFGSSYRHKNFFPGICVHYAIVQNAIGSPGLLIHNLH